MAVTPYEQALLARLTSAAERHARRRVLSEAEHHAAVIELAEIALGRADLLAQCAGLAAGFHQGQPDEVMHLRAAQLCIDAGADGFLIPRWVEEGVRRARATAGRQTRA